MSNNIFIALTLPYECSRVLLPCIRTVLLWSSVHHGFVIDQYGTGLATGRVPGTLRVVN